MRQPFYLVNPDNLVPVTRAPWGGRAIPALKRRSLGDFITWPERAGESWEVSTDAQFPSRVRMDTPDPTAAPTTALGATRSDLLLSDVLGRAAAHVLGASLHAKFDAHSPLLLKWIEALEVLSVQVHPRNGHPLLTDTECGKPESWLVLGVSPGAHYYLGFKAGLSREAIESHLRSDNPAACLHKVVPAPFDYISVPPGCVHAIGPGMLVAEPQFVLPGRSGKTWRISDWGRLYDAGGERSPHGQPRETHLDPALTAIDWSLPQGAPLESLLVRRMGHGQPFFGDKLNPFAAQVFFQAGRARYVPLVPEHFSIVTVWAGTVVLRDASGICQAVRSGESALVAAATGTIDIDVRDAADGGPPGAAFFALQTEVL